MRPARIGSAFVVAALIYVVITTRSIPERTEELAWVLAALYGVNQISRLGQAFTEARQAGRTLTQSSQDK